MSKDKPKVLIGYSACGLTLQAFLDAGCDAYTCDLLPARHAHNKRHIQTDINVVIRWDWDFAVLHPMCTYLTCSAAWAYKDPDFDRYPNGGYHQKVKPGTLVGSQRRFAQETALDEFRRLLGLPYPVAIENPAPSFVNRNIRPPSQVVQPYQFGDDASKATGLWLSEGVPLLVHTGPYIDPRMVDGRPRWGNQTDSGQNRVSPSEDRWIERSKTYPGIAKALGSQYGKWLLERK